MPKTISHEEFIKLMEGLKKEIKNAKKLNKIRLTFALGFYQCLRVSEVVKLRPQDYNKEKGFLHILAAKGKKDRDIPVMDAVKPYLKYLPTGIGIRAVQKRFKVHSKSILGKDVHFHVLRHSGATFYLNERDVEMKHVSWLLGHSRLSTTEIYTHVTPKVLKDVFDRAWSK